MHSTKARLTLGVALSLMGALGADFSGASAFEFTRRAVAFGPRPPGSPANLRLQAYIEAQLKLRRCEPTVDPFTADTPAGAVRMTNIIARFPGRSGKAIVITGHFDTKSMPGRTFVGANDGGSSTGVLLEMARVLSGAPRVDTVYLVWLDGEEAYGRWSATDSVYGSRHLADKWAQDGTLSRVKALINVDMIGDEDLGIVREMNSSAPLRNLVWKTAQELGYGKYFLDTAMATEDDHIPFLTRGVSALDLIDFDYGPNNAYWHTEKDTLDKLSAHSLEVVGAVVTAVIGRLEKQP